MAVDYLPIRNVYPTMGARSLGDIATGETLGPPPEAVAAAGAAEAQVTQALAIGQRMSPAVGFLVFVVVAVGAAILAQRIATDTERAGLIRASAVNALTVSALAVAGIPIWKWVFTKLPVPGVSTWVLSV
jgi:hypothetical protein